MSWLRWALAGSLLVNVAGGGYLVYRLVREPARPPFHYRAERMDLFDRLTTPAPLVMLGDSLTDRGEWSELLGLPGVANRGIAGDTIRGATERLRAIRSLAPDTIAVMLGINDLLLGRSVAAAAADYAALLEALRREVPAARIVVQSLLPVRPPEALAPEVITAFNRELRALCERNGCTYVDVHGALAAPDGRLLPELTLDGVHLTGAGYLRWRDVVRPVLSER